jgi:phenylalanine-4-hydroxylase
LGKAIASANVATIVYSSGLQVSGTVGDVVDEDGVPLYVRTHGPTSLAVGDRELPGHGRSYHGDGFGSPVGRPAGARLPLEQCTDDDLARIGLGSGREGALELPGGVRLTGRLERVTRANGKVVLLSFSGCRVTRGERLLFDPSWGTYDMAVGERITSVFQGAADKDAFEQASFVPHERTIKVELDDAGRRLQALYAEVREVREGSAPPARLRHVWARLRADHPEDWLLPLEILEILAERAGDLDLTAEVRSHLESRIASDEKVAHLVRDGLRLAES